MANHTDPYIDGTAIVALTNSTGGAVSNTVDDTTSSVKDDLSALASKVNEIIAVMKAKGLIP